MIPPALRKGDTIGVVGPASPMIEERLHKGIAHLKSRGFRVKLGSSVGKVHGYLAGSDAERAEDLNRMFRDPEVQAVFCTRGGYGTPRILDLVDYDAIQKHPKIFVGYSDITALHLAIYRKTGLVTFSGPMVAVEFGKGVETFTEQHFWQLLAEEHAFFELTGLANPLRALRPGKAGGKLLGGCLSLISSLVGTPFCPDFSGAVLFIEDVGEQPYQIDRQLTQLRHAGVLHRISGLLAGTFEDCEPKDDSPSLTLEQVLLDATEGLNIPVLTGLPYGHIDVKYTMPVGAEAQLDSAKGTVTITQPVVDFAAARIVS